jgi:putative flippase GtrA
MTKTPELEFELFPSIEETVILPPRSKSSIFWEMVRFALVGIANTAIDVLILDCFLLILPTYNVGLLVVYNSVAYSIGATNSFILNKYWTFHRNQTAAKSELPRFALVNLFGIFCNNSLLWITAQIIYPLMGNAIVWANFSKVFAIVGSATISFLGMRLWVFAGKTQQKRKKRIASHASI